MRIVRDPKIDRLGRLPVFEGCTLEELAAVGAVTELITVPRFRDVTREGEAVNGLLYLIIDGMVQVKRGDRVLTYLQDGDVLGRLDALYDTSPGLAVTTVIDSELLLIERRHLGPLLRDIPVLAERLDRITDRRRVA